METKLKHIHTSKYSFHFKRKRLDNLFAEAVKYPLVLVCAGAGYGKTSAIHDFIQEINASAMLMQLSEDDNKVTCFWEKFTCAMAQVDPLLAREIKKLGFPNTAEKLDQHHSLVHIHRRKEKRQRILVFDDCHFIENPELIRFVESVFKKKPPGITLFVVSRSVPRLNIAGLVSNDMIFNISEEDLRFTESELAHYFRHLETPLSPESLRNIMQDSGGWPFAINLIARSYGKAPGYDGYLRNAIKTNIFRQMETEMWDEISVNLQTFLLRLSLIGHFSADLVSLLTEPDKSLVSELEKQNAYVRRDKYIDAYIINPLFLEFLAAKKGLLGKEGEQKTYKIAGEWCNKNGFRIDALTYYEKTGDYKSISEMFSGLHGQIPYNVACHAAAIFNRTPQKAFDTVRFLASAHMRSVMCQGRWEEAVKLAEYYEARYLKLPKDDLFRANSLCSIYYCWALCRISLGLKHDAFDFDLYFKEFAECIPQKISYGGLVVPITGAWICTVGSSRKGSVQDFLKALKSTTVYLDKCFYDADTGAYELACGEFMFYQGDIQAAEQHIASATIRSKDKNFFEILHRSLSYAIRIALAHGNYAKAEQALKDMRLNLNETGYSNRFLDYDISLCWYYCALGLHENVPDWLKDDFSLYGDASFIENYANQMKARYCFATRNYSHLLSYIHDMKNRESYLFGLTEMLAIEACIHYKMKDREKACKILEKAYETASPNEIMMPFIEMGKDMRSITAFMLKKTKRGIPAEWLKSVNRKSASYARRVTHVNMEYKQANSMTGRVIITPREREILTDLIQGLTRTEIAASRGISVNTVKMVVSNVYSKIGAGTLADAIRIATAQKIL